MRRRVISPLIVTVTMALSACSHTLPRSSDSTAPAASRAHVKVATASPGRRVTKLLVLVVENHSLQQMSTSMPYSFGLAQRFGYATDYRGVIHPSLGNYVAISSGSTQGISDDKPPTAHPIQDESVFGQAIRNGKTASVYADGMPGDCAVTDGGDQYAVKHNPWAYFTRERDLCRQNDKPVSELASAASSGHLPNAGMVVPNLCHDAHDCDLAVADEWIKAQLEPILHGPDWKSGRLAVVITADEDDRSSDNKVLTVVVHPSQHGHVVTERLDHYSLSRLYSEVLHTAPLNRAASAASMSTAFGLAT